MLPVEQLASAAKIERIDINIDGCKKPHVLPGSPRRERDGLLRANQVCQRCSPSRTPRCTSISSLGFGVGGLQVHALLLQMVHGELNDELTTSNAMRRKLAHAAWHWIGAAKVLPIYTHTYTILPSQECLPGYLIRVCKWLALLARIGFGSPA